ncbi:MFS transporter [Mucilaginibacter terrenus]|uniref:MFS transporter n=1 Tax=Mucilaginibacter terrenus TaxID=2482727 RepID=A0A3E2NVT6_9SPHI|nr:MFS transporter [Mucilaginibacter terrenus]RFZ85125.1 MFS transporter [Mucilaginibacter terrenus]
MNTPTYIRPWLLKWNWGIRITFFLILLSSIMEFASIALSQNYVLSYLGAQPEDITLGVQLTYAAIITTLPIQFRFLKYFETRNYLLFVTFISILLNVAFMVNTSVMAFFFIRFFQGCAVACLSGSMLVIIPGFLRPEHARPIGSTIFYGTVLSSSVLLGLIASAVIQSSDFTELYEYLILFQIIVFVVIFLAFNARSNIRKYPLYQIDWTGTVFFMMGAISLAYTLVYGSKYYWFSDRRIQFAAMISITSGVLYIVRQYLIKRPLINLEVFRYKKFWIGLLLLGFYYGSKESINIVYGYTVAVLQWSSTQEMILGLCSVSGLIIFMIITSQILIRKKDVIMYFFIVGLSMSLIYHLWMYFIFAPDLAFEDLLLPVFFQGAASGILFVPIMIFTLTSVPVTTGYSGLIIAAFTRFTSLLNAGAGFYNLQLYYGQIFKESFLIHLTSVDVNAAERLNGFKQLFVSKGFSTDQAASMANASLAKSLAVQAQLLSSRATFLFIAELTGAALLIVVTAVLFQLLYTSSSLNPIVASNGHSTKRS